MLSLLNLLHKGLFLLLKVRLYFFKLAYKKKQKIKSNLSKQKIAIIIDNEPVDSFSAQSLAKDIYKILYKNSISSKILFVNKSLKKNILKGKFTLAFIASNRVFSKEGTLQAILDDLSVKYTGSNHLSMALCLNKVLSKKISIAEEIMTPKYVYLKNESDLVMNEIKKLGFPLIVKPNHGMISMDVSLVKNIPLLKKTIRNCLKSDNSVILEEYIDGLEVSVGVLGNHNPKALGILTIESDNFISLDNKKKKNSVEINRIKLSLEKIKKISLLAEKLFSSFNCSGFARFDFIIKNNKIYFLEVNGLPGLFETSFMTKSAEIANISREQLIMTILELALKK